MPNDSNYPSFNTGVALPVPSFATYYDAKTFIQQHIPNYDALIHSVKLGYFDDGYEKMDTALLIFTHNEKSTDKILHILGNIQPRTFLNNTFHVRNINLGLDGPSNFGFFKANDHDESMAQTFIVQQAKINCDPSASSIEQLRSIITTCTDEKQFFQDYITLIQSNTSIGHNNDNANQHSKTD